MEGGVGTFYNTECLISFLEMTVSALFISGLRNICSFEYPHVHLTYDLWLIIELELLCLSFRPNPLPSEPVTECDTTQDKATLIMQINYALLSCISHSFIHSLKKLTLQLLTMHATTQLQRTCLLCISTEWHCCLTGSLCLWGKFNWACFNAFGNWFPSNTIQPRLFFFFF